MEKLLYSVEEAAVVIGLGRSRVYELLMRNEIGSVKSGKRRLVPRHALEDYARRLEAEAPAAR